MALSDVDAPLLSRSALRLHRRLLHCGVLLLRRALLLRSPPQRLGLAHGLGHHHLRTLDRQQRAHRCRRLQASVRQDHRIFVRWLHRLGFTYEGRMEAYGADGSPYLRFARFCDDSPVMLRRPDAIGDGQAIDGI